MYICWIMQAYTHIAERCDGHNEISKKLTSTRGHVMLYIASIERGSIANRVANPSHCQINIKFNVFVDTTRNQQHQHYFPFAHVVLIIIIIFLIVIAVDEKWEMRSEEEVIMRVDNSHKYISLRFLGLVFALGWKNNRLIDRLSSCVWGEERDPCICLSLAFRINN